MSTEAPVVFTRYQLAAALGVNPDTVTDWLREGLSGAVIQQGGHGREQLIDGAAAVRWWLAKTGRLNDHVLEDMRFRAERRAERATRGGHR